MGDHHDPPTAITRALNRGRAPGCPARRQGAAGHCGGVNNPEGPAGTVTGAGERPGDGLARPAEPAEPAAEPAAQRRIRWEAGRELVRGLGRSHPDSDLALWAAGATFFGIIGVVPIVLVSLRLAAALVGPDTLTQGVAVAVAGIPQGHGTPEALRVLTVTALTMTPLQTAIVLFPASLYGEGLRLSLIHI